jgi:DNA repair exonuclease SbcCD ATPase subunit
MFNFFRRKAKEKPQGEEVKFSELNGWAEKSNYATLAKTQFQNEVKDYINGLSESLVKTGASLEQLKAVSLENRKADERVKGIVLQNKEVYVGQVSHLIGLIQSEIETFNSYPLTYEMLKKFAVTAVWHLNNFSKQSFKSFHITSELIGKELENIVRGISEIDAAVKKMNAIDSSKVIALEQINKKIEDLAKTEQAIETLKNAIAEKVRENEEASKKIINAEKRNDEIQKSEEWAEKQNLIANISALNDQLKKISSDAGSMFLAIEKALKKWAWKEKNDNALLYLENPLARIRSKGFAEILEILTKVKEAINQDGLDIDEKRKEQFIQSISMITKEKLEESIKREDTLKEEISTAEQELSKHNVKFVDMAAMITQKGYVSVEITKLEKKQAVLEQEAKEKKNGLVEALKTIGITLIEV